MSARRQQIEDAASTLFEEHGYAATSMRDIARLVDLQGGSLYAHVTSKEDVLWSIVDGAARRFLAAGGPIVAGPGSAVERLRALVRAHVEVVTQARDRASVFLFQWTALGPERRAAISNARDEYEGLYRELLTEATASGELAVPDPKLAAIFALSVLNAIVHWYRPDGSLTPDQIAKRLADLIIGGLVGDPTRSLATSSKERQ
jgi:TetR/AcrR family transcriptional regulator, cholesterol catabolism regulator